MSIKAKIEAIVYAAEEPITFEQIVVLVKDEVRLELMAAPETNPAVEQLALSATDPQNEAPVDSAACAPSGEPRAITEAEIKAAVRAALTELVELYGAAEHGIEVRQIAGGYRMATKPEHHDLVRSFAKSLKPPIRLSLPALETLAVIAYKQPVTAPEIAEIRGVDASGVLGTLLDRKLITTGGRKQVIGRPILYKTTKEFLLRFGLKGVEELPSMEEFEKLAAESFGTDLFTGPVPSEEAGVSSAAAEVEEPSESEQSMDAEVEPQAESETASAAAADQTLAAPPRTSPEARVEGEAEHPPEAQTGAEVKAQADAETTPAAEQDAAPSLPAETAPDEVAREDVDS